MIRSKTLTAVALAALAVPAGASAQDTAAAPAPKPFCFNGARQPKCSTFVIAEMQGSAPLLQTTRDVSWSGEAPHRQEAFGERLQWEVGLMHNVSDRWAVGGAARLGSAAGGALNALTVRARRWMADDVAVDVSAGASLIEQRYPEPRTPAFTGDVRLNFRDDAYVGLRYDQLPLAPYRTDWGSYDAGGRQHALSLLAGVGSEWALGGTAATGLGMILLLALVDWE